MLHSYIGHTDMITLICNSKSVLSHFGSMYWIVFEYLDNISLREFFYSEQGWSVCRFDFPILSSCTWTISYFDISFVRNGIDQFVIFDFSIFCIALRQNLICESLAFGNRI